MKKRIVVIGSSNTDMVVKSQRLPHAGETVIGGVFQIFPGGKGANQAVSAARAGGDVTFIAALGRDALGDQASANFSREGIDISLIKRVEGAASGVALILVNEAGENIISVAPGANLCLAPTDLDSVDFTNYGFAVFQLEIPVETVARGLELARKAGCVTVLNPAPAHPLPPRMFHNIDCFTPNQHEIAMYADGTEDAGKTIETQARALLSLGCRRVIVTRGAEGVVIVDKDGAQRVAAPQVKAVDTVGAGDCFTGCFVASLSAGSATPDAARYACHGAALSVQKPGAQTSFPADDKIRAFMNR